MTDRIEIAERVRRACVEMALTAYEDAGFRGLCGEGRWEYAIDAVRQLDLEHILTEPDRGDPPGRVAREMSVENPV